MDEVDGMDEMDGMDEGSETKRKVSPVLPPFGGTALEMTFSCDEVSRQKASL